MMEGEEILKVLQHVRRSLCSEPEEGRPAFGEMFHCNQVSERSFDLESVQTGKHYIISVRNRGAERSNGKGG